MKFTSRKAIIGYFAGGAVFAVFSLLMGANVGFFLCLAMPFFATGFALIARRNELAKRNDAAHPRDLRSNHTK